MGKKNDEGGYCFDLLKEGVTSREMSGWGVSGVSVSV